MENTAYMYTSQDIVKMIQKKGQTIVGKIIGDAIAAHSTEATRLKANYLRYTGDRVPIFSRTDSDRSHAANKKVNNDFAGDTVDQLKGYVFGADIKTTSSEESTDKMIQDFKTENAVPSLDTDLAEYMLSCGYATRMLYVQAGTGVIKAMNTKPWQTIVIVNESTEETDYAIIYYEYTIVNPETGKQNKTIRAEFYDKTEVSYYIKQGSKFILETGEIFENGNIVGLVNPQSHLFDFVPVVKFIPNSREQCVFHKAKALIDAYDEGLSDWLNEIIEFRNAYLVSTGSEIDEETAEAAKRSGVINLTNKDDKLTWLVKNLNPQFIENLLKIIESNIYKFSKTVNMSEEAFLNGSAESGEARKWRLLKMVFEGIVIEKFFTKGLQQQYKVLCSVWSKGGTKHDFKTIAFKFTRTLPVDLLYYANVNMLLDGKISDETRFKQIPFVTDPEEEKKQWLEDAAKRALAEFGAQPGNNQDNQTV